MFFDFNQMICALCKQPLIMKGSIRPNVATFECGHHFHLDCTLQHAKSKMTIQCFKCKPTTARFPNLGDDRIIAMESLIKARQEAKSKQTSSWWASSSLKSMVGAGASLSSIQLKGYVPEDFIQDHISWKKLQKTYTFDALMDFGFRWHHMLVMGFEASDFKMISWNHMQDLDLTASDMLKTSMNIRDLAALKLEPYQLNELGFTWSDFVSMGGNARNLKLLTDDMEDLKTYFEPDNEQLHKAGFNEVEKKSYKNVQKTTKKSGMIF